MSCSDDYMSTGIFPATYQQSSVTSLLKFNARVKVLLVRLMRTSNIYRRPRCSADYQAVLSMIWDMAAASLSTWSCLMDDNCLQDVVSLETFRPAWVRHATRLCSYRRCRFYR